MVVGGRKGAGEAARAMPKGWTWRRRKQHSAPRWDLRSFCLYVSLSVSIGWLSAACSISVCLSTFLFFIEGRKMYTEQIGYEYMCPLRLTLLFHMHFLLLFVFPLSFSNTSGVARGTAMSVCLLVQHFCPVWNISTTIGWMANEICYIHVPRGFILITLIIHEMFHQHHKM